ncbi:MAG: DUF2508 family protein [Oscillospiraceae bacterium]|nr:DUF2508 family protein [Oscillospiraceae bacterium]MBQ6849684.1 DUF2508 family protein [Oscillospiraceae bacterium]MBR6609639.1 DUF2508 family protein [Oscillospiraceae bacterium]
MNILRKAEISPLQRQKEELINELRDTQKLLKQAEMLFEMTVEDDLIEARIYHIKSLAKHQDYLISALKGLGQENEEKTFVNV